MPAQDPEDILFYNMRQAAAASADSLVSKNRKPISKKEFIYTGMGTGAGLCAWLGVVDWHARGLIGSGCALGGGAAIDAFKGSLLFGFSAYAIQDLAARLKKKRAGEDPKERVLFSTKELAFAGAIAGAPTGALAAAKDAYGTPRWGRPLLYSMHRFVLLGSVVTGVLSGGVAQIAKIGAKNRP